MADAKRSLEMYVMRTVLSLISIKDDKGQEGAGVKAFRGIRALTVTRPATAVNLFDLPDWDTDGGGGLRPEGQRAHTSGRRQ